VAFLDRYAYEWLLENADIPIRYRVLRELCGDDEAARKIESDYLSHPELARWICNLKQEDKRPRERHHGYLDAHFENAIQKCAQLGMHAGLAVVRDAAGFFLGELEKNAANPQKRKMRDFYSILSSNLLSQAGFDDRVVTDYMLGNLDVLWRFVRQGSYDIYISNEERDRLPGVPPAWRQHKFLKPELVDNYGFCYPLVYDILGLHKLYELGDETVSTKVDDVIHYIADDRYHREISDGYGILIEGKRRYLSIGWDAKFPGWDNAETYLSGPNPSQLLYFVLHITKYPLAVKTRWFEDVRRLLETYKTQRGTYLFPAAWLLEKTGYAVGGQHMSFGENRRKKNWREVESTFYMALLDRNLSMSRRSKPMARSDLE
jgi:hypothetical protein